MLLTLKPLRDLGLEDDDRERGLLCRFTGGFS